MYYLATNVKLHCKAGHPGVPSYIHVYNVYLGYGWVGYFTFLFSSFLKARVLCTCIYMRGWKHYASAHVGCALCSHVQEMTFHHSCIVGASHQLCACVTCRRCYLHVYYTIIVHVFIEYIQVHSYVYICASTV